MKQKRLIWVPLIALPILAALVIVGCTTTVPMVSTVPNPTNGQPMLVTNVIHVADSNFIAQVAASVAQLNAATAPFNPYAPATSAAIPTGTAIALGLSTLWAGFLNWRKGQTIATQSTMLASVVKGVESGVGTLPPDSQDKVKSAIQDTATAAGVNDPLHTLVKSLTT